MGSASAEGFWAFLQPYMLRLILIVVIVAITYVLSKGLTKIVSSIVKGAEIGHVARIVEISKMLLYLIAAITIANILAPEALVFAFLILLIGLTAIVMFLDVLRNVGSELYVRSRIIVRRGDWIDVDGVMVKVLDFDAVGIIGETTKLEKVFIPYTKLLNSIVINRTTPLGTLFRVYVDIPRTYGIDGARNMLIDSLTTVKEDLATEPDVTYVGSKGELLNFVIEFHIINHRKLTKVIASIEREVRNRIPEAIVRT